jgi:hypothetical protein
MLGSYFHTGINVRFSPARSQGGGGLGRTAGKNSYDHYCGSFHIIDSTITVRGNRFARAHSSLTGMSKLIAFRMPDVHYFEAFFPSCKSRFWVPFSSSEAGALLSVPLRRLLAVINKFESPTERGTKPS